MTDVIARNTCAFLISLQREGKWPGSAMCAVDGDAGAGDYFSGALCTDIAQVDSTPLSNDFLSNAGKLLLMLAAQFLKYLLTLVASHLSFSGSHYR
jgi:hypothetical protein